MPKLAKAHRQQPFRTVGAARWAPPLSEQDRNCRGSFTRELHGAACVWWRHSAAAGATLLCPLRSSRDSMSAYSTSVSQAGELPRSVVKRRDRITLSVFPRRNSRCRYSGAKAGIQAATLKRSKRSARRSRSGRSLSRFGRWIVPPLSRFNASSIGPSFCPSSRGLLGHSNGGESCRREIILHVTLRAFGFSTGPPIAMMD